MDISNARFDNDDRLTLNNKGCTHLYYCDGKGCDRNCAEVGYDVCRHTSNEKHAATKCRRNRKFSNEKGIYVEV